MFAAMLEAIKEESVGFLFNVEVEVQQPQPEPEADAAAVPAVDGQLPVAVAEDEPPAPAVTAKGLQTESRPAELQYSAPSLDQPEPERTTSGVGNEPGRNAPCPCGSGKKYKRCHGAPAAAH
jgi:preprotein translocase subunit SecA